jgi:transposase
MGRKPKPAEVRAKFFTARASGATLKQAAEAAGVSRTAGQYWLAQSGGVRPRVRKPRPALRLSLEERETISRGLAQKRTFTAIAAELGRSVSTVSREVARNSGVNGYRAARADRLATARTARPRAGKLADEPGLRLYVEDKLALRWSPEQISQRLLGRVPGRARDAGLARDDHCSCRPRRCCAANSRLTCAPSGSGGVHSGARPWPRAQAGSRTWPPFRYDRARCSSVPSLGTGRVIY